MYLPNPLIDSLRQAPGFDEASFLKVHELREPITSIRFNPAKRCQALTDLLESRVPWSSEGYYLRERPFFTFDPFLHAGAYYVQEASSMFLEQALRQTGNLDKPLRILDLCAAPGGKSTLIQSLMHPQGLLVSNEVIRSRVSILVENLTKWGLANQIVTSNDAKDFQRLPAFFDCLVVDAPCSGSGLFRRDPGAVSEWSPASVELCSQRQQRILADALPSLKENGVLIYSTCSFSAEEDEQIADWLVSEQGMLPVPLTMDPDWGIVESRSSRAVGYRFYPDKLRGEGFYLACFRKESDTGETAYKPFRFELPSRQELALVEPFLKEGAGLFSWKLGDRLLVFPEQLRPELGILLTCMYIRKAGISVGKFAGKDLLPDQELAMSLLSSPSIPSISLKKEMALQYLRREEVKVETDLRGWVLAEYEGLPLGWMKVLPNRVNNYYPKEWRILKGSTN